MTTTTAFVAMTRFGLGARPGDADLASADPRGWLVAQLADSRLPDALASFASSAALLSTLIEARAAGGPEAARHVREEQRKTTLAEAAARTRAQIDSNQSFRERLVAFWANHFSVSIRRPEVVGIAGAFEREAIRPYVTGRFRDMLGAVVEHPAMLLYLDNAVSLGPRSKAGVRRERGLNENLARELLELHTLGVDGGYGQNDVREFAKMLTGWTIGRAGAPAVGRFVYAENFHEPGAKTLLGVRYEEAGKDEVDHALDALAKHPSTARHVATKLARHFIADKPPADAVDGLARVYRDSDGDLGQVARALVATDAAWQQPLSKVKTPGEFVVSALRSVGVAPDDKPLLNSLRLLGQVPFTAPSPAGWPDTAAAWAGPEALLRRTELATTIAARASRGIHPEAYLDEAVGPLAGGDLRQAVERAPSTADAMALVLASPTFQRR